MIGAVPTFEIRRLQAADEAGVLAFELENRAYFARSVSDRGEEFFAHFSELHRECLEEHEAGRCLFHVLVEADGSVIGRVNLYDVRGGAAVLGYRVAERAAGRGVTSDAVARLIVLAESEYELRLLRAVVADDNLASRRVLEKTGFVVAGPVDIHGRPATSYRRELASRPRPH